MYSTLRLGSVAVDVGNIATITKMKPKSFSGAMREMLTDSDLYEMVGSHPQRVHSRALSSKQNIIVCRSKHPPSSDLTRCWGVIHHVQTLVL